MTVTTIRTRTGNGTRIREDAYSAKLAAAVVADSPRTVSARETAREQVRRAIQREARGRGTSHFRTFVKKTVREGRDIVTVCGYDPADKAEKLSLAWLTAWLSDEFGD